MAISIDLSGRTILVCGVGIGGIGGHAARQIAQTGAHVIAVDQTQAIVDHALADIKAHGGSGEGIVANLMDPARCEELIQDVLARHGRIHGVANIAGGTRSTDWMPLEQTPDDIFDDTINLNLAYVFRICRGIASAMIRDEVPGAFVNVTSVSGLTAAPFHGPYGAAKSGMAALTRTMAFEWGKYGIRANSVAPGAVITQRIIDRGGEAADVAKGGATAPDMVWTLPEELASAIVFLLSDLASGVSGQNLVVDSALSTKFCGGVRQLEVNKRRINA